MSLTTINIWATISATLDDEQSPYYQRTLLTSRINSSAKFGKVSYKHLGFDCPIDGKRHIRRKEDFYSYVGMLDPCWSVHLSISPLQLFLENAGDGFMAVSVRLGNTADNYKISILQEKHQPKQPKLVDLIWYEGIWYAMATINCLQTLRIEEITQSKGDS